MRQLVNEFVSKITERLSAVKDRTRDAFLTSIVGVLGRVVQYAINVALFGVAYKHLSAERFGVWAAVATTLAIAPTADLGASSGVQFLLSHSIPSGDRRRTNAILSNGLIVLAGIAAIAALLLFGLYPHVPWASLIGAKSEAVMRECGPSVVSMVLLVLVSLPLNIAHRYNLAAQRGYRNSIQVIGVGIMSIATAVCMTMSLPLWVLSAVYASGPLFGLCLIWIAWIRKLDLEWRFDRNDLDPNMAFGLLATGGGFFLVQLGSTVALQLPIYLIGSIRGAESTASFAMLNRIVAVVPMAIALMIHPLWPAYAEALVQGEKEWIKRMLNRTTLVVAVLATVLYGAVFIGYPSIAEKWLGNNVVPTNTLILYTSLLGFFGAVNTVHTVCLSGCGKLSPQLVSLATAAVCLAGALLLLPRHPAAELLVLVVSAAEGIRAVMLFVFTRLNLMSVPLKEIPSNSLVPVVESAEHEH